MRNCIQDLRGAVLRVYTVALGIRMLRIVLGALCCARIHRSDPSLGVCPKELLQDRKEGHLRPLATMVVDLAQSHDPEQLSGM